MNKIYSLKYSHITGGLVAVSELTRKVTSRAKKLVTTIIVLSGSAVLSPVIAADLNINKVWARDYLDLAQNKGIFKAGATNINLQLKDGSTFKFPEVAIPDFSPASNKGATTSIGGAYSVTAAHNSTSHHAIATQSWGQTDYNAINRMTQGDFAVQRLSKFVVETTGLSDYVDFSLNAQEALERYGILHNGTRQIVGFRAGSGSTYTNINGSQYSTGQAYNPILLSASMFTINWNNYNRAYNNQNGFYNESTGGDSGSGYYLFDNKLQKWVIAGVHGGVGVSNKKVVWAYYTPYSNNLVNNLKDYFTQKIHLNNQEANISQNKININNISIDIEKNKNNQNKDLYFYGGGKITLNDNLALGYGGFVFDENKKYSITGSGNIISSAGIDIGNGTTVDWNIQYTSGDNLHKIGEGTLDVKKAQNTNLKIGNGTVILNAEKTFNNIYMASGNSTVKLNHDKALGTGEFQGIFFTENGGTLDLNGHSQTFQRIAATDGGTTITNTSGTEAILAINNSSNYIFHGNIQDNIKLTHEFDSKRDNSRLIIDGDINTNNDISVKNSQLTLQGHATEHAVFREGARVCHWGFLCEKDYAGDIQKQETTVNKNKNTNYKTNNQVASFEQPDWDNRSFQFRSLTLENASFSVGRNASVRGDILATNSDITLGDNQAYIDLYSGKNITGSGFSFRQQISSGVSTGETVFSGQILSEGGSVKVGNKASVTLTKSSSLDGTELTIDKGGIMTAQGGLFTSKEAHIAGILNLTGSRDQNNTWSPSLYLGYGGYNLNEDGAQFTAKNQASVTADITSNKSAEIYLGRDEREENKTPDYSAFALSLLNGFDTVLEGKIDASQSMLTMKDAQWKITADSSLKKISMAGSMVRFNNENRNSFNTLTVDELSSNNSAFVMRTNTQQADKLIVKNKLEGENNLLLVDFIEKKGNDKNLNIDLVKAPENTSKDVFKTEKQTIGFSDVTPEITQQEKDGQSVWTLTGYKTLANTSAVAKATSL
ncbi:ESPR-type extended signal peptide-containing protein, partial [Escherichia coli]|nr:ESPR-type extended signal peptide-containing protein [Escherichia coli]